MDTLILVQDDQKLKDALKKIPIQLPGGLQPTQHLITKADPTSAEIALGVQGDELAASFTRKRIAHGVKSAILQFSISNFNNEAAKPPAKQKDICQFQVVIMFHQSSSLIAEGISDGLYQVQCTDWLITQPTDYVRVHRVARVWLLSCESAADVTGRSNTALGKYVVQALRMRQAAANGLVTLELPPIPTTGAIPKLYPDVYTFSTGNPVTGAVRMHPNHMSFVETPNWEIHNGQIRQIPNTQDVENPAAGTVYKYSNGSETPQEFDVAKGAEKDLLSDTPPF